MGRPIRVIAIDPSGNYEEGKGITGYIEADVFEDGTYTVTDVGSINSEDYPSRIKYYEAHKMLLQDVALVIIEDYRLYNHAGTKAAVQSYSLMETPRLLGVLEYMANDLQTPIVWQMAHQMKAFDENVLVERGELIKKGNRYQLRDGLAVNRHERSALKHFLKWFHTKRKEK